ncbi:MAG: hypothetical protein EA397_17390 [Deltaproteobacteria bacterium]|nr:MAG: hypothetical protein EA397_17390 [Deltaproteobacteria bacterium]
MSSAELAERIAGFLNKMRQAREPDVDVPRSEALGEQILIALTPSPWNPEIWSSNLDTLSDQIAVYMADEPSEWARELELLSIYFDTLWTTSPHHGASEATQGHGEGARRSVPLALSERVARAALPTWSSSNRSALWERLDEWDVWRAALTALPSLDMPPEEAVVMLSRVDAFAAGDMGAGLLYEELRRWVERHVNQARDLVEGWCARTPPMSSLPATVVSRLARDALACQWDRSWRDDVVAALSDQAEGPDEVWPATQLVFYAWPEGTSLETRGDALIAWTSRRAWAFRSAALRALFGVARERPLGTLRLVRKILDLEPPAQFEDQRSADAGALAQTLGAAGLGLAADRAVGAEVAEVAFDLLKHLEPTTARLGWDGFLAKLARTGTPRIERVLKTWLAMWSSDPFLKQREIGQVLPLTVGVLRDRLAAWLVTWAAEPSPWMGNIALRHLSHVHLQGDLSVEDVPDGAVRVAALRWLGSPWCTSHTIERIASWAVARPSIRPDLIEAIATVGLDTFPGATRSAAAACRRALGKDSDPSLAQLEQAIARREASVDARRRVPSSLFAHPCAADFNRLFQARMRRAQDRDRISGVHPLHALFSRVPVARGEGVQIDRGDGRSTEVQPFTRLGVEAEYPARDSFDPVGAALQRWALTQQVNAERGDP